MSVVSSRYAESFFALGLDKKLINEYKEDLINVKNIFNDVENIKDFFISERVSKADKKKVIKDSLSASINKDTLNFLFLLVDKGRIGLYEDIINSYIHLANEEMNIKEGVIESARPLPLEKIKELEDALSSSSKKVELKQRINKELISGFRVVFDNQIIDASMKDKINKLRELISRKEG